MVKLKYLILLIFFVKIFHSSVADNSTSVIGSIVHDVLPDCFFGVETISFVLYTRNITEGVAFTPENITNSDVFKNYLQSRLIVILVHGFVSNANNSGYLELAQALLQKEDCFVISIDWKHGACSGGLSITKYAGYEAATKNTRVVGEFLANFTQTLVVNFNVPLYKILVIGHSLGAHVVSFAAKQIQKIGLGEYLHIIGLDPASPFFITKNCSERLCKTDAVYVQVIHTTATLGLYEAIGSVDFYMNRGRLQPGCNGNPSCSHSKSVSYLTETIKTTCCFIGTPWTNFFNTKPISSCTKDTCVCVGLNAIDYPARGRFYVKIENKFPYCNNNGKVL